MAERATALRRRRLRLGAAAAAAFLLGLALGAGDGPPARDAGRSAGAGADARRRAPSEAAAREAVDALSLERQVGRLVVLRFAGTAAPAYVPRVLRKGRAAGVILFGDNVVDPPQVRSLTAAIRANVDPVPLVSVDQEGGAVRNLPWAGPERSAPEQAAAASVRSDARAAAQDLRAAGVNVSLAPVADVPSVAGAALAGRAFSSDPVTAAGAVAEAVHGWLDGGVAPTVKHFPGLGGATVNTDDGPAVVGRDAVTLRSVDLAPFQAGISAGAPLVMVGHASYPALDGGHIASQSEVIVDSLLRRELGFRGVVMTDSLEAAAVQAVADVEPAALASVRAGVDVILTTGRGSYIRVYRALLAEARRSGAFRARVRESAARVLALQATL